MSSDAAPVPDRLSLRQILYPRSVAVFGASEDKGKFGGRILYYLMQHGFSGRILPINPNRQQLRGLPCYPKIGAAPGPVDLGIIAVPSAMVGDMVEECAAAGVGAVIVVTTGFAEAGPEGETEQRRLVEIRRRSGMRIIGPNCMGLMNLDHDMTLTSSLVLEVDHVLKGEIGLVSQSGALMVSMFNRAHDQGIGFSLCVSLGNQCDVDIADVFEFMVEDEKTRVICLYIEGLVTPLRFLDIARRARAKGKPVFAVKTGRTEAGVRAARSHTSSLAGSYAVFAAACRDAGVILTEDPDAMVIAAEFVRRWGDLSGDGIGLFSSSGGGAGIGVDRVTEAGMRLAALSPATKDRLLELLLAPQADNPIDLGGRRGGESVAIAGEVMRRFAADPDVATILTVLTTVPFYEASARELATAALASGKPVLFSVTPGSAADAPRRALREVGCPFVDRIDDAIRALGLTTENHRFSITAAPTPASRPAGIALPRIPAGPLDEPAVKALLAAYGIAGPAEKVARDADAAVAAARAIGFPVAMKAVSRTIVHKSDIGGVKLDLADEAAARRAWNEIDQSVRRHAGADALDGCLVSAMIRGGAELIIGLKRDEQFGPVVLVGFGGVLVELVGDVEMALAPVSPEAALAMLRRLKLWPLLDGYRGRPKLASGRVAELVARASWLAADLGPRLVELDINPLIVGTDDAIAVDARATLAD